jgi:CheY-like chemotaxis protein
MAHIDKEILHILLVDDDKDDTQLFTDAAGKLSSPFLFSKAEDGEQLLKFLSNKLIPDIIFLDLNMPGISGRECLRAIRSNSEYDMIPVIIYSTSSSPSDVDACFRGGASMYIVKPHYFSEILSILRNVLAIDWNEYLTVPRSRESFVLKLRN